VIGDDMIQVDMGEPVFDGRKIPSIFANEIVNAPMKFHRHVFRVTLVSMGNPHAVIFTDDVDKFNLEKIGPVIENDLKKFPKRINVEIAQIVNRRRAKARVWERGVGETLACGTGACAVAVAASINGMTDRLVRVDLPGGMLAIKWTMQNHVLMTGPAAEVYTGSITV
jgi:diaminopimelate epimerase